MKLVNLKEFLALPGGSVYQKVDSYCATGPICVKGDTISESDWFLISLDFVSLLGDTNDMNDKFQQMEKGESVSVNVYPERDGTFDDDDMFLVMEEESFRLIALTAVMRCVK